MVPKDKKNNKEESYEAFDYKNYKPKEIPKEQANKEMEKFFGELEEHLKDVPQEVIEEGAQRVVDFVKGKLSWADILNVSPDTLKQLVEVGYAKFQAGRLEEAERFFKVLTILDFKNGYFHSMLATILQRQKRNAEALVHYTEAIDLNPHDIVSFVNRGEIYLQHGWIIDAEADFKKAVTLESDKENKFVIRAKAFLQKLEIIKKQRKKVEEAALEAKKKEKKKK